ncbi:hypothetical protein CO669_07570 [Bradyrhizobium sp. Y36]|uniref:FliM/FliN family flagellar motor switch protein n=1 Tax=Bradyrhizobium sp. Y36 TaxID=2035447 RepID=UPI000BE9BBCE|nr:FliM/FliN family flagellar motor switch protein [Bradyrhizobium sp. Y36]PDT90825.1 hypothetical protein CO669_07570 [Bradyrhizobium sp. Y36]
MTIVHWQPPAFTAALAHHELWNAILSYREVPLSQGASSAAFRFSAIDPPDPAMPALLVQPDGGPLFAAIIDTFPFGALFGADLEMPDVHDLPPALRSCIEEGMVGTIWDAIPDNHMGRPRIVARGALVDVAPRIGGALHWLSLSIDRIATEPVRLSIGATMSSFASVVASGAFAPAAVNRGLADSLATEACHTLGSLRLSYRDLAALRPGDVVALPQLPPDLIVLRAQGRAHAFRLTDENWVCLGHEVTERYRRSLLERVNSMSEDHDPLPRTGADPQPDVAAADAPVATMAELGVIVDFDVGRMSIPLAQVQAWQPGAIVSLDRPALENGVEVAIRANGQLIGTGDLIRIDERIGVRITRVMSSSA